MKNLSYKLNGLRLYAILLILLVLSPMSALAASPTLRDGTVTITVDVSDPQAGLEFDELHSADHVRFRFDHSGPARGLWSIDIRRGGDGPSVTLRPSNGATVRNAVQSDGTHLTVWDGLRKSGEQYPLRVIQRWRIRDDGRLAMDLQVDNQTSDIVLERIRFPVLMLDVPEKDRDRISFAIPHLNGRLLMDVFNQEKHGAASFRFGHPSRGIMPFIHAYLDNAGFLLYDEDRQGFHKDYLIDPRSDTGRIYIVVQRRTDHLLEPGRSFAMPDPCVMTAVEGDWFDGAQAYRTHALTLPWAAKGPLSTRSDVPQWYKDSAATFVLYTRDTRQPFTDLPAEAARTLAAIGWPEHRQAAVFWYQWQHFAPEQSVFWQHGVDEVQRSRDILPTANVHAGQYFPAREGMAQAITALRQLGMRVIPFMNTRIVDPLTPGNEQLEAAVIRSPSGELSVYSSRHPGWDVSRASPLWQARYRSLSERLIREFGASGIYLDSMGGMSKYDYSPSNTPGRGGGLYQVRAMRDFCAAVHTLKQSYPDIVLIDENGPDALIDLLDGTLNHYNITYDEIPLRQAIYHDYWLSFGRTLGGDQPEEEPLTMLGAANLFITGRQIGRITLLDSWLTDPQGADQARYIGRLIRVKDKARAWLNYGVMLRPPTTDSDMPRIIIRQRASRRSEHFLVYDVPAVMASAWRAPDGRVAVALTNHTADTVDAKLMLPLQEYVPDSLRVRLTPFAVEGGGADEVELAVDKTVPSSVTVQPHQVLVYEIKP